MTGFAVATGLGVGVGLGVVAGFWVNVGLGACTAGAAVGGMTEGPGVTVGLGGDASSYKTPGWRS